jgi:arginase
VLVVGGDWACAGVVSPQLARRGPYRLVWFDAHGDFNTPRTSLSGKLGGMPVAVAAGQESPNCRELPLQPAPLPTDRIVMVDVRTSTHPRRR